MLKYTFFFSDAEAEKLIFSEPPIAHKQKAGELTGGTVYVKSP